MSKIAAKYIAILDFGGQYAHLIASKIRRLGAFSKIFDPQELRAHDLDPDISGLIYSGGPASVYHPHAIMSPPELLETGVPVLGICYGHQLIMHQLGGKVSHSNTREYGPANLRIESFKGIFAGEESHDQCVVWMSHGDEVEKLANGFEILASTSDCKAAAVYDPRRNIYGIQFHPEVRHSVRGDFYLSNFIGLCGVRNSWDLHSFMKAEIEDIQARVRDKKVFLLCSGGVDSTVAFALLAKALPADHIRGLLIDTGFMRQDEATEVLAALKKNNIDLEVVDASADFFKALKGVYDPEQKRQIIGSLFVDVQAKTISRMGLNADEWYFGQGTIYPDTIESGATKHSNKIKTHHNRVEAIEKMIQAGKVVEPLAHLYKDEVRDLGRMLGLPDELVDRHPFPGPGLAVRCLCTQEMIVESPSERQDIAQIENMESVFFQNKGFEQLEFRVLPLKSVGVQGDQRSYARPLAIFPNQLSNDTIQLCLRAATSIPNQYPLINRVLLCLSDQSQTQNDNFVADDICLHFPASLEKARISILQKADKIVHDFQLEKNIYKDIWQFPVVLIPVKKNKDSTKESLILRPIVSSDAMTASCYPMSVAHLETLATVLYQTGEFDFIFYDLTSKPPGTIEWE